MEQDQEYMWGLLNVMKVILKDWLNTGSRITAHCIYGTLIWHVLDFIIHKGGILSRFHVSKTLWYPMSACLTFFFSLNFWSSRTPCPLCTLFIFDLPGLHIPCAHSSFDCFPFICLESWRRIVLTLICLTMTQFLFELFSVSGEREDSSKLCVDVALKSPVPWQPGFLCGLIHLDNKLTSITLTQFYALLRLASLHHSACRDWTHNTKQSRRKHWEGYGSCLDCRHPVFALERKWLEGFPHCLYEPGKHLIHPITSHSEG